MSGQQFPLPTLLLFPILILHAPVVGDGDKKLKLVLRDMG